MNVFCPNCENEVSEKASSGPKCGHPFRAIARPIANGQSPVVQSRQQALAGVVIDVETSRCPPPYVT